MRRRAYRGDPPNEDPAEHQGKILVTIALLVVWVVVATVAIEYFNLERFLPSASTPAGNTIFKSECGDSVVVVKKTGPNEKGAVQSVILIECR